MFCHFQAKLPERQGYETGKSSQPPQAKFPAPGVTPAVIGCIEATAVIKYLTGTGDLLPNRILIYDGLNMKFMELTVKRNPKCEYCGEAAVRSQQ